MSIINISDSSDITPEGLLETAFASAELPVGIIEGKSFRITYANKQLLDFWNMDQSAIGKTVQEVSPQFSGIPILHSVYVTETVQLDKGGSTSSVFNSNPVSKAYQLSYAPIRNKEKEITGILITGQKAISEPEAATTVQNSVSISDNEKAPEGQLRLQKLLEAGKLGYFELWLDTGQLECSAEFKTNLGLAAHAGLSWNEVMDAIEPGEREQIDRELKGAAEKNLPYSGLYEVKWPDGSIHWIKSSGFFENDKQGTAKKLIGVTLDITADKAAEEKQGILAAIVSTSDDTILSKTLNGIITSWNKSAERMFGYTADEIIGKHITTLIPPSRLSEEDHIIGNISRGNRVDHFETIRITKEGKEIPISLSVSPIKDASGKIIGASKIARDISSQKRAEEKQAMLAAIVDTSDDTILSKTLQGIITSWNKAAEQMFGYTEEEIIGKHISILIPPDRLQEEEVIIGNIAQGKRVDHFETIRRTKDGRLIPISLSVSPVKDSHGNIIGASKIARDITSQMKALEAAQKYTESLEIINSVGKSISEELELNSILQKVTDATTRLTAADFGAFFYNSLNTNGEAFSLFTISGMPKKAFEKFCSAGETDGFHPTFNKNEIIRSDDISLNTSAGENVPCMQMPEGSLPVKSYLAVPVVARNGQAIGGLVFGHKEQSKFDHDHESLVAAIASQAAIALDNAALYQEIKSLNAKKDEFIGLASHELKTPLTSISGYLQILERINQNDSSRNFVTKTIQQVNKLTSLVSDLLDISKIEAGKLQFYEEEFSVNDIIDDAVELIRHSTQSHEISLLTDGKELIVQADKQRMEQVILNLLTNAIKYSPNANKIEVTLSRENGDVKIGVKDFGMGIPRDKIFQIFTRFYRVEDANPNISGLGIGLYIAKEIVDRHKGKIWVESEVGKGSTFWISIPLQISRTENSATSAA